MAHPPQSDEANALHGLIHILDCAGPGPESALRQRRGHELVEIAIEHA
jgi:hypothetical protein